MSVVRMKALDILNGLKRELRHRPMSENEMYKYISGQFQTNRVTSAQFCRSEDQATHLGETYLCYLTSVRKHSDLLDEYQNKGEKTTEQAANTVGLTLPKSYKD